MNLEGGLEVLDKSDASIETLMRHAAGVLNVDLSKVKLEFTESDEPTAPSSKYTFKEQWVLRWLTRKVQTEVQVASKKSADTIFQSFLTNTQLWSLLSYVLNAIPDEACVEILVERKFVQYLDQAIQLLLPHSHRDDVGTNLATASIHDEYGHSSKRRRLSPEPPPVNCGAKDSKPMDGLLIQIVRVCSRISVLLGRPSKDWEGLGCSATSLWSSTTKDNASMLAAVVRLVSALATLPTEPFSKRLALDRLLQLTSFWESRPIAASISARAEEVSLFCLYCLDPCLELLDFIRRNEPSSRGVQRHLEKLIALNLVLPLRTQFIQRHSKSWKSQADCVTWKEIHKMYAGFNRVIDTSSISLQDEPNLKAVSWVKQVRLIYEIAIRVLPRGDLQRRQQEQPWLDALLLFLSYVSCPQLAKFEVANESLHALELGYASGLPNNPTALKSLLQTAIELGHRSSFQVLSYLTSAIVSWNVADELWRLLALLVKLDPDVFVSNSGLATSTFALEALMQKIEVSVVSQQDFESLRDAIMIPLLEGHARSRALKGFIARWTTYMPAALRISDAGIPTKGNISALLVWQDEDLFEHLAELYPLHGASTLTRDLLSQAHTNLKTLVGDEDSALDLVAHIAFVTAVASTLSQTTLEVHAELLFNIRDATATALRRFDSDYQGQRWRLWKLIRVLQQGTTSPALSADLLNTEGTHVVSPASLTAELQGNHTSIHTSKYLECMERFALITQEAARGTAAYIQAFKVELDGLHTLATYRDPNTPQRSLSRLWSGRTADLDRPLKLVTACIAITLTKPKLLKAFPEFTLIWRQLEVTCTDAPDTVKLIANTIAELDELNSQDGMAESWLTKKGDDLANVSDMKRLWQAVSVGNYTRSQVRTVGEKAFPLIKRFARESSVEGLTCLLAAMDRLSASHAMVFTRADAWDDWMQLLGELECHKSVLSREHLTVMSNVKQILIRVWVHVREAGLEQEKIGDLNNQKMDVTPSLSIHGALTRALAFDVVGYTVIINADSTRQSVQQYSENTIKSINSLLSQTKPPLTEHILVLVVIFLERLLVIRQSSAVKSKHGIWEIAEKLRARQCEDAAADILRIAQSHCDELCAVSDPFQAPKSVPESIQTLLSSDQFDIKQDLYRLMIKARNVVAGLDAESLVDLLLMIYERKWLTKLGILQPIFVALLVTRINLVSVVHSNTLVNCLDKVANLSFAISVESTGQLALAIENSKLVLERHSDVINQNTLDTLLSNICQAVSLHQEATDGSEIPSPASVFDRICSLLGSVLSRFRRRLADRHHLLLPVVQSLLKCFFFPGKLALQSRQHAANSFSMAFSNSLPTWLKASDQPLPASSAIKFSRLLSTICNPTVSAAKSSRRKNHNELNDETKRVKALSGQHMQYLVMEYARCSLDGEIKPAVKEKLLPGMYTVLDAMGREVMRGMNAAMDPSSRAIFKTLFDDWVRYGKWDNT